VPSSLISQKLGYESMRDYLANQALIEPGSEMVQRLIYSQLKPVDARRIFESRLANRPLLVEWHRAYQFLMQNKFGDVDILSTYRKSMEADPKMARCSICTHGCSSTVRPRIRFT